MTSTGCKEAIAAQPCYKDSPRFYLIQGNDRRNYLSWHNDRFNYYIISPLHLYNLGFSRWKSNIASFVLSTHILFGSFWHHHGLYQMPMRPTRFLVQVQLFHSFRLSLREKVPAVVKTKKVKYGLQHISHPVTHLKDRHKNSRKTIHDLFLYLWWCLSTAIIGSWNSAFHASAMCTC